MLGETKSGSRYWKTIDREINLYAKEFNIGNFEKEYKLDKN